MHRRCFVASAGLTAVSLGTGCVDALENTFGQPPRLGWVAVKNYNPEPQRFQIQLEHDGETIHDSTHQVAGKRPSVIPGEVVECTWGDLRGPFSVRGRVGRTEWVEQSIDSDSDPTERGPDCVIAEADFDSYHSETLVFSMRAWCEEVPEYNGGCAFANRET